MAEGMKLFVNVDGEIQKEGKKKVVITWDSDDGGLKCSQEGFDNADDFIYSMLAAMHSTLLQEVEEETSAYEAMLMITKAASVFLKAFDEAAEKALLKEVLKNAERSE